MALFFLGEMGGLFTLAYSGLAIYLLKPLILLGKANTKTRNQSILLFLVLVGFFVHSTTYDSLRYPHLNWIFHSLLGLIANNHSCRSETP